MALKDADKANFDTLMTAIANNDVALIETAIAETGEYRAAICTVVPEAGEYRITPFAIMIWDDPFTLLRDPTVEPN